jgi:hypothetical protein
MQQGVTRSHMNVGTLGLQTRPNRLALMERCGRDGCCGEVRAPGTIKSLCCPAGASSTFTLGRARESRVFGVCHIGFACCHIGLVARHERHFHFPSGRWIRPVVNPRTIRSTNRSRLRAVAMTRQWVGQSWATCGEVAIHVSYKF